LVVVAVWFIVFIVFLKLYLYNKPTMGQNSSAGIATRYRVGGIESRWEASFSAPVQAGPGAHPASYTMGTRSFSGVKKEYGYTPLLHLWAFVAGSRVHFNKPT
jgi:hypothetical protein